MIFLKGYKELKKTMTQNMTTKERILDSALTLFAERGYDGVGVDLIAEMAGLKGPSIYKHFKSKEEILNVLIDQVEVYYTENFGSEMNVGKLPDSMDELIAQSLERIEFTLHDEKVRKIRRILAMEQFRNPRIAQLATRHSVYSIQGLYQRIFEGMMDAGLIKREDPRMLSMSFASPITLLIQMCDREPEREHEALELIKAYLDYAVKRLAKADDEN